MMEGAWAVPLCWASGPPAGAYFVLKWCDAHSLSEIVKLRQKKRKPPARRVVVVGDVDDDGDDDT